jgi:hypothetical protein
MIRYAKSSDGVPLTLDNLKEKITALKPTWFTRAKAVLDGLSDKPKSSDFTGLWSEIKDIYINLQHSKCVFCEQPLEGRITQDVEHFRPKAAVSHWKPPQDLIDAGLVVTQPANGGDELGYQFLAYHPLNYAAACKNCNSVFKGNLFPVAKKRKTKAKKPPAKASELPYLIYPIGNNADDPEQLVEFVGCVPQPIKPAGHDRFRAQVTINIFKLDDAVERRVFYEGRARAISLMFLNLDAIDNRTDAVIVNAAKTNVNRMLQDREPFASCLRCFHRLYQRSPAEAKQKFLDATVFLDTISP